MSNKKSYIDQAYEILLKRYEEQGNKSVAMPFSELFEEVVDLDNLSEELKREKESKLYTALTVDGRFVIKENNAWVLKEKEEYENVHIDMNAVYSEVENEEKELLSEEVNDVNNYVDEDEESSKDDNIITPTIDDSDLEDE